MEENETEDSTDRQPHFLQDETEIVSPEIKARVLIAEIEQIVKEKKLEYIDAIVWYCHKNQIDIEVAGAVIKSSPKLKAKIQLEAEELNYLPKRAKLPL